MTHSTPGQSRISASRTVRVSGAPASLANGKFLRDGRRALPRQGRHLRHVRARRTGLPVPAACADRRRLPPDGGPRHQHRPHLHAAAPRSARRSRAPRPARHGRPAVVAARRVSRRPRAEARRSAARSSRKVARARRSSRGAAVRARQRDSARRRPLARPRCASSASCATCTRTRRRRRPTACSPTSTFRRPSSSTSRSSTSARSTSTCTASPSCARTSRGCSTSPARSRCCSPKRAPTASAKAKTARPRSPRCTSAPRSRKARAARSRSRGPTNGGAAAIRVEDWAFGLVDRERRPKPAAARRRRGVRRRAVLAPSASATWPRVSVVVCAYNAADTLDDCLALARAADLSGLRGHPRQRRLARSHRARSAAASRACASSTSRTAA